MGGADIAFAGSIIAIIAFVLGNIRAEASKRAGIYKKIDEEREKTEIIYVRKDICITHHSYLKETLDIMNKNIDEIKEEVKKINGNRG